MLFRFILILFLSFNSLSSFEQSNGTYIETTLSFNIRFREIFNQFYFGKKYTNWKVNVGLGYGTNTLFNASKLFYSIPINFNRSFVIGNNMQLGPLVNFSFSGFKSLVQHSVFSSQVGYEFTCGKRFKFIHRLSGGTNVEHYRGNTRVWNLLMLNAEFSMGLRYDFN